MKTRARPRKPLSPGPMPDYENPPVVEVALSVQFKELSKFQTPYAGFLWQEFREQYPEFEEKPPLPHIIETFPQPTQPTFTASFRDLPPARRVFFVTAAGNNVIQIQPDRFVHNWRKVKDEDEYPRYGQVRGLSLEQWSKFLAFAEKNGLGEVAPDQYELTYVNHMLKADGWDSLADVGSLFRDVRWASGDRFLPEPEALLHRMSFPLPESTGRLHVALRQMRRIQDAREVLVLDLTARGFPTGPEAAGREAMLLWFDVAREWIVRGFADLCEESAQRALWRRIR